MNIFQNIRIRLTLWYLLIVAILVTFSGGVAYILLSDSLSRRTIDPWDIRTATMEQHSGSDDFSYTISNVSEIAPQLGIYSNTEISYIKVFTRQELLQMADESGVISFKAYGDATVSIDKNLLLTTEMTDAHFIWFYLPNSSLSSRVLIVSQSAYNMNQTLGTFRQALLLTSLVTLILAGILGFFLINRMLHPVQAITKTAREIQENNLSRRLDIHTNDELGSLAKTLNQTFSRLEAAFVREREFTADASHELRTPLAIAQGEATLALKEERSREDYQKAMESISRQLSRTSSLINRLLFLARSDDRIEMVLTEIDLNSLISESAQDARVLCEPKQITLDWKPEENPHGLIVRGDIVLGRPMGQGCPVQHVLRVIDANQVTGVLTCHTVGPRAAREGEVKDVQAYHVVGFEGIAKVITRPPEFGFRQAFLPSFCMMQIAHTGVVNLVLAQSGGLHIRVEDIRIL